MKRLALSPGERNCRAGFQSLRDLPIFIKDGQAGAKHMEREKLTVVTVSALES